MSEITEVYFEINKYQEWIQTPQCIETALAVYHLVLLRRLAL